MGDETETIFPPEKAIDIAIPTICLSGYLERITKEALETRSANGCWNHSDLKQTSYPETEAMPSLVHGSISTSKVTGKTSAHDSGRVMGSAGAMISDMNDIGVGSSCTPTGKTCGAGTYNDLINCIPFWVTLPLVWELHAAKVGTATPARFPATTRGLLSPETGTTIVAWINYQSQRAG